MLIKNKHKFLKIISVAIAASLFTNSAIAGLFDDDEARRLATEAKEHAENRLQQQANSLVDLHNLVQQQNDELAALRGQVEKLTYDLELLQKRQQDLYGDLDSRMQNLESPNANKNTAASSADNNDKKTTASATNSGNKNNSNEVADYENALNSFKAAKYPTAITAFNNFIKNYTGSSLLPNAYYWLGNAYYAQGNCKSAIATQKIITQKFSQHSKAADAWLAIAACQQESGDNVAAKKSYQTILSSYAKSSAAEKAKKRLENL